MRVEGSGHGANGRGQIRPEMRGFAKQSRLTRHRTTKTDHLIVIVSSNAEGGEWRTGDCITIDLYGSPPFALCQIIYSI